MRKFLIAVAVTLITLALGAGVALGVAGVKTKTKGKPGRPATTKGKHKHHRHKRPHKHRKHHAHHTNRTHHTAKGKHKRTHKRHTAAAHRTSAPVLRVSGTVLKWTRINKIRRYQLATIRHPATTRNTTYRIVKGTRFKLASTGGQTIKYSVRADVRNARWSKEVSVRVFKRRRTAPRHATHVAPPSGAATPVTTPTPVTTSPAATQKLVVAVNNSTGWFVDPIFAKAGINATRLDIDEGSGISVLKTAISHGMHPLPLYTEGPDGNLTDLTPAQCGAEIAALVPQLKALGITTLEFGNESYLTESAATYGAQYNAAHIAAQGSGVKLLAVATTDQYEEDRGGTGSWFSDLIKALPGGAGEIDALTLHPYGPMTSVNSDGYGWPMVATLHSEAVAAGISPTLPWYLTEVGQEISGSGIEGQAPVSESTQASDATQYLNDIKTKYPWVVYFDWYSARDDSSGGFGLLNSDDTPRPAFTAIQNWIAANPTITNG
jgi:hypothetical protein